MIFINCIQKILQKKGILPLACFWLIGVCILAGRCCYDLKTYFFGDTLVYRFVSLSSYDYLLHLPVGYSDFGGKRPLLIYLHGAGETGQNVRKLKQ
ncbi:MAG: hypothetical protein LBG58_11235, partial [Planctomycetaceae bacterium]|nr:hypothetical protein [Planctomycetaceae bacterium]